MAGIPPQDSSGAVAEGIEITGTLSREVADSDTLLIFAFVNVPPDIPPQALEPASVSAVAPDRRFGLSNVPPGSVTLVLLTDKGHDGAIDPGDPIAVLDDPYRRLAGLRAGDQVTIKDVTIDGAHARAAAAVIKVQRAAGQLRWEARRPRDLFRPAVRAVYIGWERTENLGESQLRRPNDARMIDRRVQFGMAVGVGVCVAQAQQLPPSWDGTQL